jgi:hypothetical protein
MNIVWSAVRYMAIRGLLAGAGLGALYGTAMIFALPISTFVGGFLGGIVGLLAGAGCGLVAGMLTAYYFYPLTDALTYRRILTAVCTMFGLIGTLTGLALLFQLDIEMVIHSAGIPLVVVPSLIAAGAAAYVSKGFATRYAAEKRHKKETLKGETVYG